MTSRIAPTSICKIIAPAHPAARGKTVSVLRLAVGCPDIDGAHFVRLFESQVVWVVKSRGSAIPWGDDAVHVLAIGEECLSPLLDSDHDQESISDAHQYAGVSA